MTLDLDRALDTARKAVETAAHVSLPHFRRGVLVEKKPDHSPVTAADRESESAILSVIRAEFPAHSILAEESGMDERNRDTRWIVDPLDGTRGFSRGGSFWGPLVALEHQGKVVVGAMALPVLGDVYWAAIGRGCYRNGERLRVSNIADWREATLSVGELGSLLKPPHGEGVATLIRTAASTRGYGDPAGAALVLLGRAEVWLEAGVKTWDIAPQKILIEEAGGVFSSFDGRATIETGTAIASNGLVHEHVLRAIRGESTVVGPCSAC